MSDLEEISVLARDKLEIEAIVLNAERIETGRFFRRILTAVILLSYLYIGLHSAHLIDLPQISIQTFSYLIPSAVVALCGDYVRSLGWLPRPRSSRRSGK
jgi:hypothetical protein